MFTGLVSAVGTVVAARPAAGGGLDQDQAASYRGVTLGESIAVDGACLTVARKRRGGFGVRIVATTLERTDFGRRQVGDLVNLERALRAGDPLGGHLVQGHVDGVARVTGIRTRGDAMVVDLAVPASVARLSIPLGSITVAGVSLTINAILGPRIVQVSLIPVTREATTLGSLRVGDRVHVEADLIARYLAGQRGRGQRKHQRRA
jgi:riboflavin synthase